MVVPNYLPRFSLSGHVCQSIKSNSQRRCTNAQIHSENEASFCHDIFVSTRIKCGATTMADSKARFKTRYTSLYYNIALAEVISFGMLLRGHPERVTDGHRQQQLLLPQFYPDWVTDNHRLQLCLNKSVLSFPVCSICIDHCRGIKVLSEYSNRYSSYMMPIHNNTGSGAFRFMDFAPVYCSSTIKGLLGHYSISNGITEQLKETCMMFLRGYCLGTLSQRWSDPLIYHQIPDLILYNGRHCIILNHSNNSSMEGSREAFCTEYSFKLCKNQCKASWSH